MTGLLQWFKQRKAEAIARARQKAAAERQNAELNLLADDLRFHGRSLGSLEEPEYKSAIGEDFEDEP